MPISPLARSRLLENHRRVEAAVRAAERRSGRLLGACRILAVVKRRSDAEVHALLDLETELGHPVDIAENRVQALAERSEDVWRRRRPELIGSLQRNKVRRAVLGCRAFHALDRLPLAEAIDRIVREEASDRAPTPWPVYLQVNVAREPQKHGCTPEEAAPLAEAVLALPGLELRGLMAMAPLTERAEESRPTFAALRELSESLRRRGVVPESAQELSMGMSDDFEVAVEEGATVVRVGSALFQGVEAASDPGPSSH